MCSLLRMQLFSQDVFDVFEESLRQKMDLKIKNKKDENQNNCTFAL